MFGSGVDENSIISFQRVGEDALIKYATSEDKEIALKKDGGFCVGRIVRGVSNLTLIIYQIFKLLFSYINQSGDMERLPNCR